MPEKGIRPRRVAELVQAEISRLLIHEFQDPNAGFLTVTRVEMTADLRTATVYLSVFGPGDRRAVLDRIEKATGYLRRTLASRIKLKYNPELFFSLDPGPDHQERIDKLIEETKKHGS
jgi:ribosome-binding factor A